MATKTTHHCDRCDKQLSYVDVDGYELVSGIRAKGEIEFTVHERHSTGYGSFYCSPITDGLFCSYACLAAHIDEELSDVKRFKNGTDT